MKVSGRVANTGHGISFFVDENERNLVNVSGASLSYKYQVIHR
jgi:hypothetical protein